MPKAARPKRTFHMISPFYTGPIKVTVGVKLHNTWHWQKLREAFRAEFPLCRICRDAGRTKSGRRVDHIVPREIDDTRFFHWDNLQTLCHECDLLVKQPSDLNRYGAKAMGLKQRYLPCNADGTIRWPGGERPN